MNPFGKKDPLAGVNKALDRVERIIRNLRDMSMDMADLNTALGAVGDTLQKALTELVAALAAQGQTTPEVDAAVGRLQAAAKALDDLNPDAPTP